MANNFKKIHGRLVRDVELTTGNKDGKDWSRATFTIAVDNDYPNEHTSFYEGYIFGKKAEALAKFTSKGSELVVFGEHQQEPYTNKEGKVVRPWRFAANGFEFCGSRGVKANQDDDPAEGFGEVVDDDIPF